VNRFCYYIFGLEQLGDGKECLSGLSGGEVGPLVDEVEDLREDNCTLASIDVVIVEGPCLIKTMNKHFIMTTRLDPEFIVQHVCKCDCIHVADNLKIKD